MSFEVPLNLPLLPVLCPLTQGGSWGSAGPSQMSSRPQNPSKHK